MDQVMILMATWQGEKFLEEQIDSILAQDYPDFRLVVQDDASEDATQELLDGYAARYPDKITVRKNRENVGSVKNFLSLLTAAVLGNGTKEQQVYYMFADQDDLWYKDKVRKTLRRMKQLEKRYGSNVPALVFTDSAVVGRDGKTLAGSFCGQQHYDVKDRSLAHLLMENVCQGCTMMLNGALAKSIKIPAKGVRHHDWWIALTASAFGHISFLPEATMQYRQHGENVVGASGFSEYVRQRAKSRREQKTALHATFRQAKVFLTCYGKELKDGRKKRLLRVFCTLPEQGALARRKAVLGFRFHKSGFARNLGLLLNL